MPVVTTGNARRSLTSSMNWRASQNSTARCSRSLAACAFAALIQAAINAIMMIAAMTYAILFARSEFPGSGRLGSGLFFCFQPGLFLVPQRTILIPQDETCSVHEHHL